MSIENRHQSQYDSSVMVEIVYACVSAKENQRECFWLNICTCVHVFILTGGLWWYVESCLSVIDPSTSSWSLSLQ